MFPSPWLAQEAAGGGVPPWVPTWLEWFYRLGEQTIATFQAAFNIEGFQKGVLFVLIVIITWILGKLAVATLRRTMFKAQRMDQALARLLSRLVVLAFMLIGVWIGIGLFGTSVASIATGLGLLSLALGFGMQNTVANMMGGISLAVDRPFRIGDRIKVGDYWGTVQHIGLRSTRIETPRSESVIIPNKIMEEREIWNYTMTSLQYRLDINVGISYDSHWPLAEKIMLEVAEAHPNILHYPKSRVVVREFGDSSVNMQLRAWIADVTLRADTISDILKGVKDRFEQAGVEIPYSYRTLVEKSDLPKPFSPRTDVKPFRRRVGEGPFDKLLVAVAGPQPVRERSSFVASLAKSLNAGVVALYIQRPGARPTDGENALRILGDVIRGRNLWYKPVMRTGDIVTNIRDVAREENVALILVGAGGGRVSNLFKRSPQIGSRLRNELARPVFTVPRDLKLDPALVAWLKEQMLAYSQRRDVEDAEPSAASTNGAPRSAAAPAVQAAASADGEHEDALPPPSGDR